MSESPLQRVQLSRRTFIAASMAGGFALAGCARTNIGSTAGENPLAGAVAAAGALPVVVWLAELMALQRSGDLPWSADLAAAAAIFAALMSLAMVFAGGFSDRKAVS